MANPATLTINSLVGNGAIAQPAAQTIDTNGNVPIATTSDTDRVYIEVVNTAAAALTTTVKAGVNPPALRAGVGDLVVAQAATGNAGANQIIGPFESARFSQADGSMIVNFTAAAGNPAASVRVYKLPKSI